MKNMSLTTSLKHIKGDHLKALAENARCDESYVRKIINGERETKSVKARAILKAAKQMNEAIENITAKVQKELIIVGEND